MIALDDETAVLETGSRVSGTEMFYLLPEPATDRDDGTWWSQPIPREMGLAEGEYYALVKGLRVANVRGYSMLEVTTNSPPIIGHLRDGESPPDELMAFYETAVQLAEQFEAVSIIAYAVDARPSG